MKAIVTTKAKADKMLLESLFNPTKSLTRIKFDSAKYKWLGSQKKHIEKFGEYVQSKASDNVRVIWFEQRRDQYGSYCQIMSLC